MGADQPQGGDAGGFFACVSSGAIAAWTGCLGLIGSDAVPRLEPGDFGVASLVVVEFGFDDGVTGSGVVNADFADGGGHRFDGGGVTVEVQPDDFGVGADGFDAGNSDGAEVVDSGFDGVSRGSH